MSVWIFLSGQEMTQGFYKEEIYTELTSPSVVLFNWHLQYSFTSVYKLLKSIEADFDLPDESHWILRTNIRLPMAELYLTSFI